MNRNTCIGYRLSNGFSIEGELMYRRNEFDGTDLGGFGSFSGGDVRMEIPSDSRQTLSATYEHWSLSLGAGFRF